MSKKYPIILDTDIGSDVDDLAALIFALYKGDVLDIKAISTVYGRTSLRAAIVQKILNYAGVDSIPVITGKGKPLTPGIEVWESGHEGEGILDQKTIEKLDDYDTGELKPLYNAIDSVPGKVTILAIGPLTNIATLIREYPSYNDKINSIIIMGGNFRFTAGSDMRIEHNFQSDPEAVDIVLKSGIPTTILGLDVTLDAVITLKDVEKFNYSGKQILQVLAEEMKKWIKFITDYFKTTRQVTYLHDPLTIAYLINPEFFDKKKYDVQVVVEGEDGGKVYIKENDDSHISVVHKADTAGFMQDFMKTLLS